MTPEPAAPIPQAELQAVLATDLDRARTLPASVYTSPQIYQWEQQHLFDDGWVCVGRSDLVGLPGDQRAVAVGERSVLLTRDKAGVLHAFRNSCRHRGHELLPVGGSTNRRAVTCPYHAWAYCLDGPLRVAPQFQESPGFEPAAWSLLELRSAELLGWVFVNVGRQTMSLTAWLAGLGDIIGGWGVEEMRVGAARDYHLATNWKTIIENYAECYHCPSIHPQLCRVSPPDSGASYRHDGRWNGGRMELRDHAETMSLDGRSGLGAIPALTPAESRHVHYFYLAPSLLVALHPDFVLTHRLIPREAGSTDVECHWLFPAGAVTRADFDPTYAVDFWDVTNRQDFAACESVYRSVLGGGYRPGVFAAQERGSHAFQAQIAASYLRGEWTQASHALLGLE